MTDLSINSNSERRYYHGWINFIIRLYYFLQEGNNQINNFKTVALGLLALAVALRIETDYWLVGALAISVLPILTLIGWLWVIRGKKSTEYFQVRYTSPYGRYGIELQEEQMRLLKGIKELLENGKTGV